MQGAILSGVDVRDYQAVYTANKKEFPKSFELEIPRVKDQGDTGACVAYSLSSIIEYYNNKQNGDPTEMSVGYIYGNRTTSEYKGVGMVIRDALEAVRLYGDVYKDAYDMRDNVEIPTAIRLFEKNKTRLYSDGYPHRISQYCRVGTINAMKASIMAGNPVLIGMLWYNDMKVIDGVLRTSYIGHDGGHCMFIIGWDERGWKVQNSWGTGWGDNGTAIIPYSMPIAECWTLTDDVIEGIVVKKPFSSKPGKAVAKLLNNFCRRFKR